MIIFPPRPKGKMLWTDLPYYEKTGLYVAQRKFRGSNSVLNISKNGKITLGNRHGREFSNFKLSKDYQEEILSSLKLKPNTEYWFNGEIMNKDENAKNEIIFFDILQEGRYFFQNPDQMKRLEILKEICNDPKELSEDKIALQISSRLLLAETFEKDFVFHFKEAYPIKRLEGLVLKKKKSCLDDFGHKEYETSNSIRCRKPFSIETPKDQRSGGYEF
ncbi:MAG: hypothetical protein EKK64_10810 [Neisseriaceae bacterium]|nr:MAG: hypothetical protein EKK64_10810 [Neisseriaceae bacterium]